MKQITVAWLNDREDSGRGYWLTCFLIVNLFFGLSVPAAHAKPTLALRIADVTVTRYDAAAQIPVFLTNQEDTIAGFEIFLYMSHPQILALDTINPVTFTGGVVSDWEFLDYNLFGLPGSLIKIVGIYNVFPDPPNPDPLSPRYFERLLLTLHAVFADPRPDTLCDSSGTIMINDLETRFSDRQGNLLDEDGYDGAWRIICPPCGDVNKNGVVNIADVVFLIAYIFSSGPAPNPLFLGDVNCNGFINIADVVYLVAYIFSSGPEPCAGC